MAGGRLVARGARRGRSPNNGDRPNCGNCGLAHCRGDDCLAKEVTCFRCRAKGHYARCCRLVNSVRGGRGHVLNARNSRPRSRSCDSGRMVETAHQNTSAVTSVPESGQVRNGVAGGDEEVVVREQGDRTSGQIPLAEENELGTIAFGAEAGVERSSGNPVGVADSCDVHLDGRVGSSTCDDSTASSSEPAEGDSAATVKELVLEEVDVRSAGSGSEELLAEACELSFDALMSDGHGTSVAENDTVEEIQQGKPGEVQRREVENGLLAMDVVPGLTNDDEASNKEYDREGEVEEEAVSIYSASVKSQAENENNIATRLEDLKACGDGDHVRSSTDGKSLPTDDAEKSSKPTHLNVSDVEVAPFIEDDSALDDFLGSSNQTRRRLMITPDVARRLLRTEDISLSSPEMSQVDVKSGSKPAENEETTTEKSPCGAKIFRIHEELSIIEADEPQEQGAKNVDFREEVSAIEPEEQEKGAKNVHFRERVSVIEAEEQEKKSARYVHFCEDVSVIEPDEANSHFMNSTMVDEEQSPMAKVTFAKQLRSAMDLEESRQSSEDGWPKNELDVSFVDMSSFSTTTRQSSEDGKKEYELDMAQLDISGISSIVGTTTTSAVGRGASTLLEIDATSLSDGPPAVSKIDLEVLDDEVEDETAYERLVGLTEMFPESVVNGAKKFASLSASTLETAFVVAKKAAWIATTTSIILFAPVVVEMERVRFEEAREQHRMQFLFPTGAGSRRSES